MTKTAMTGKRRVLRTRLMGGEALEDRLALAAWDLGSFVANAASPISLTSALGTSDIWKNNHSGAALYDAGGGSHKLLVPVNNDDVIETPLEIKIPGLKVYDLDANYIVNSSASRYIKLENFDDVEAIVSLGGDIFAFAEERKWEFTVFNFANIPGNVFDKNSPPTGVYLYTIKMVAAGGGTALNPGNNDGIEGLAYDPDDGTYGTFYAAEEMISETNKVPRLWRVPAPAPPGSPQSVNATATLMTLSSLPGEADYYSDVDDFSDLYFQEVGGTKYLYAANEETSNGTIVRMTVNAAATPPTATYNQRFFGSGALNLDQIEGLTFTPDGLHMIATGEAHEFKIYGQTTRVTNVNISASSTSTDLDVPVGDGEQLRAIDFAKVDRISITFNQHVDLVSGDLVVWGDNNSSSSPYAFASTGGFSYNSSAHIGTWTLDAAQLPIFTHLRIKLTADNITDVAGNILDGDWLNPTSLGAPSSDTYPSGDGDIDGDTDNDFIFYVILAPDYNGDNETNFTDLGQVLNHYNQAGGWADGDFDGSGMVDFTDLGIVLNYYNADWINWPTGNNSLMGGGGGYDLTEEQAQHVAEIVLKHWDSKKFSAEWLDDIIAEIAGGS